MTIARNLCVAVIYTDVRGEVRYYATSKSGTPPVWQVPLNMGVWE